MAKDIMLTFVKRKILIMRPSIIWQNKRLIDLKSVAFDCVFKVFLRFNMADHEEHFMRFILFFSKKSIHKHKIKCAMRCMYILQCHMWFTKFCGMQFQS